MKGRSCTYIFVSILALLFTSVSGYGRTTTAKESARHKKIKRTSDQIRRLNSGETYSVQRGDSLSRIARDFGITAEAIQSANGLRSSRIKPGQLLTTPGVKAASTASLETPVVNTRSETFMSAAPPQPSDESQETDSEASSTRLRLVQAGFQLIGVRYRFGGDGKSGFDCSGLVKNLFSKFNIDLPRSSREQYQQGEKISRDELQMGDLVFFSSGGNQPTHVGIYVGNDKMLHAARKARQVIVSDINKIWYKMRYLGARRVIDLWSDDAAPEAEN